MDILKFLNDNAVIIAAISSALLAVSESLPFIDKVKANGLGQLFLNLLGMLAKKK